MNPSFISWTCLTICSLSHMVYGHGQHMHTHRPRYVDIYRKPQDFVLSSSVDKTSFTESEKTMILNLHNAYRSMVVPEATDMRELVWDNDLEEFARNHTHSCTGAHSHRSMIKKWHETDPGSWQTWNWMGEVLYYRHSSLYSIEEAMWMWWREGEDYNITTKICVPGKECGHYLVMTTAKNSRVGCSINVCDSFSISRYPTPATYIACVYDAQYFSSNSPYTVGTVCSECTRQKQGYHFQYCRHKLCVGPYLRFLNRGFTGDCRVTGL